MANEQLVAIYSQHTSNLNRVATSQGNAVIPYIDEIYRQINIVFASYSTRKRITPELEQKIRDEINKIVSTEMQAYIREVKSDQRELGLHEAQFGAQQLDDVIKDEDFTSTVPAAAQITAAAVATPIKLGEDSFITYNSMMRNYWQKWTDEIDAVVAQGFAQGQTIQQIQSLVLETIEPSKTGVTKSVLDRARRSAKTIAITGSNHYANQARVAFAKDNDDVIKGYEFISVIDSRTSQQCRSNDGRVFKADDPKLSQFTPPLHPNACLKGTMITTINGEVPIEDVRVGDLVLTHNGRYKKVTTVMAREYSGMARDLKDSFGRSVSLTNEHPILTKSKGWINCGDMIEGDVVFYNTEKLSNPRYIGSSPVKQRVLIDSHNIESKVADELISYGIFSNSRGVSSSINLNNSVGDNEVGNISTKRFLEFEFNSEVGKKVNKQPFVKSWISSKSFSAGFRRFFSNAINVNWIVNFHSFARKLAKPLMSIRSFSAPVIVPSWFWDVFGVCSNGVNPTSSVNTKLNTPFPNSVVRKPILPLNEAKAFTFLPVFSFNKLFNKLVGNFAHSKLPFDKWLNVSVTSIVEYHHEGYVYNLSVEEDETYVANGVLVHNCRSALVYQVDERYSIQDEDSKRQSNFRKDGKLDPKPIDANQTYYEALKKLSASDQDAILGPTLGKAFRKLDNPSEFAKFTIDSLGQPLSIKQMKERDNALSRILNKL